MIDLIDEASQDLAQFGYKVQKADKYAVEIGLLHVGRAEKERLGFEEGDYCIVNSPLTYKLDQECHAYVSNILQKYLKSMTHGLELAPDSRFLIVGVGNPEIWADSLGKKVVDKIEIDAFDSRNRIFKICPNIYLNTGISTFDTISILAKALHIDCLILIDSLATNNIERLGISFQLNSAGLTPGSALKQNNRLLSQSALGIKCLSFGVPFMIFASALDKRADRDLILAPKDIHENIEISSKIIATAINATLRGDKR